MEEIVNHHLGISVVALVLNDTQFLVLDSAKESVNFMFAGIPAFSFLSDGPSA